MLEESTQEMRYLRKLLSEDGHPFRRTFERSLRILPETVPAKRATAPHTWVTDQVSLALAERLTDAVCYTLEL